MSARAGRWAGSTVQKGSVLYFAGENPTDIQMRWLGLTQDMRIDPAAADVHFVPGAVPLSQIAERIIAEVARKGLRPALVVVDTAAAYFEGDDENNNTQAVDHAKRLRSLTMLPGGPCVLILTHPTKRAAEDDLIPRGGGAFLAEVDGNIALQKRDTLIVASAQGKFRGREFAPISFELKAVHHPLLKDSRGRDITTVIARPLGEIDKQQIEAASRRDEDTVLRAIERHPDVGTTAMARKLNWLMRDGKPYAVRVQRAIDKLVTDKMIAKHRDTWVLTSKGEKELNQMDRINSAVNATPPIPTQSIPGTGDLTAVFNSVRTPQKPA